MDLLQTQTNKISGIKDAISNSCIDMPLFWIGILWVFVTSIFITLFPASWTDGYKSGLIFICVFAPAIILMKAGTVVAKNRLCNMASELEQIDDIQATVLMIDLLSRVPRGKSRTEVENALSLKLMKVQRADGYRLNIKHRLHLYRELEIGHVPLTLAIIHIIQEMRWLDAIPYLTTLIRTSGTTKNDIVVIQASSDCCDALYELSGKVNARYILLRPSDSVQPNELLRPTSGTAQATPEETAQLLRPVAGQDDAPDV